MSNLTRTTSPKKKATTRKASQETIMRLYDAIGLNDTEKDYQIKKCYTSAMAVLTGYYNNKLDQLNDKELFPKGFIVQASAIHTLEARN